MDRNNAVLTANPIALVSLSARRAWIEIPALILDTGFEPVALRKESVDRNMCSGCSGSLRWVALRKESVDRNCGRRCPIAAPGGRSPQGERG